MEETLKMLVPIIAAHICVLAVVILIIKRLLLSDSQKAVARIKEVETEVRRKEETVRRDIEEHEQEFAKRKSEAETELEQRREEAEKEVARMRDQVIADAKKEGERIISQAKRNEQRMREQIEQSIGEKAVEYGGEIFKLVISERVTPELNRQFIGELLDALEEVDPGTITVDGSTVEVQSSHALVEEDKKRLEELLASKFGVEASIEEATQEDLLAGLVLKMGSLEIDGSLRNRYEEAVEEVKKTAGE